MIKRKLPVTVEGLNCIYKRTNWDCPDSVTVWCTITIDLFFMLRMGEYLNENTKDAAEDDTTRNRHPLQTDEIEPLIDGKRAE